MWEELEKILQKDLVEYKHIRCNDLQGDREYCSKWNKYSMQEYLHHPHIPYTCKECRLQADKLKRRK